MPPQELPIPSGEAISLDWSPSAGVLAAASPDSGLMLWAVDGCDPATTTPPDKPTSVSIPEGLAIAVKWSPSGRQLACGTSVGSTVVWQVSRGVPAPQWALRGVEGGGPNNEETMKAVSGLAIGLFLCRLAASRHLSVHLSVTWTSGKLCRGKGFKRQELGGA